MMPAVDTEVGNAPTFSAFESKSIRLGFIRKVYGILSVQLLVSFGFVLIPVVSEDVKGYALRNPWMLILSVVLTFGSMIVLACCNVHRQFPANFICLSIFTVGESFLLLMVGAVTRPEIIMWGVIITTIVCLALTVFAFQTKIDFTVFNGLMFVLLIVLIVMGFIMMFVRSDILRVVYSAFGAFIFSAYLVIDTQMIIGGSHKYQMSPEDYVFAAITLYVDIINLFLMIISLLNTQK
ncbi:lifeguard-like protein [Dinothrombium tinctorium]|uniref:Lifeguard-like protein n=1 Tax=Dinothrombium tinctorium TaxID=1965070 RepID=A0A3S3PPT5_9ACAR|nr:lifeguard-like protein [Dinothrombium tinctorium]RWS13997.1 lifeguard-like protein [Dinothrombium tinctorium]RWS14035.1 lifeguard-like protein [Dinothrombium tinctorium]